MTTLSEKIAVMQAAERGEQIQVLHYGANSWSTTAVPTWDWDECSYRVAPKKHTRWLNVYENDIGLYCLTCETKEDAVFAAGSGRVACIQITFTEGEGL